MLTRTKTKCYQNELISATKISNFIKNDKILDYLDLINKKNLTLNSDLELVKKRSIESIESIENIESNKKMKTSFDYIMESGYYFEEIIIEEIIKKMKNENQTYKLKKITEKDIHLNCVETIKVIKENKHNIILGSILINSKNNTWGKPDLIVRGDWILKYINDNIININPNKWYIIDIKSSTINLISGGETMSSKLLYDLYKSQIYIYTEALNMLLEEYGIKNDVEYGFVLGKKYKYIQNKNIIYKKSFECLGIINYNQESEKGIIWKNIIINAIEWHNELKLNWESLKLNPINNNALYPNMKNQYDKNYHKLKKDIAIKNKEITLLWNCGIINRNLAWKNGIKRYDDPKLNVEILGLKNSSKEKIINMMLEIIHTDKKFILDKKNNKFDWQTINKTELFVDFETYNTDAIFDENYEYDNFLNNNQKIYMIGLSYFDNQTIIHKTFIIKYENYSKLIINYQEKNNKIINYNDCIFCENEQDLLVKFISFVNNFNDKNTKIFHWSCAEPIIFNKKINEYDLDKNISSFCWIDLLKIFKDDNYPIIIKECFNFGIKEIVKKLNEYGEINLTWSDLDDGLLSSFIARDIYLNKILSSKSTMYEIIEYNYIDCKALYLILIWMRNQIKIEKNI